MPVGKSCQPVYRARPARIGAATTRMSAARRARHAGASGCTAAAAPTPAAARRHVLRDAVAAGNFMSSTEPGDRQEVRVETGGITADAAKPAAAAINIVPRDGGNIFSGSVQSRLRQQSPPGQQHHDRSAGARRADAVGDIRKLYDVGGGFGGPIKRDKLWFFASAPLLDELELPAGKLLQQDTGHVVLHARPEPARLRSELLSRDSGIRATWQAAQKHRITRAGHHTSTTVTATSALRPAGSRQKQPATTSQTELAHAVDVEHSPDDAPALLAAGATVVMATSSAASRAAARMTFRCSNVNELPLRFIGSRASVSRRRGGRSISAGRREHRHAGRHRLACVQSGALAAAGVVAEEF